ncbi:hypothetical protein GCM10008019_27270 [Deinococcus soli (ex Cha et al. 2016)]|nr:hypothetical protein GCM10008019_27270 [Deinococcus soli (ex Cha et al. 2016)]
MRTASCPARRANAGSGVRPARRASRENGANPEPRASRDPLDLRASRVNAGSGVRLDLRARPAPRDPLALPVRTPPCPARPVLPGRLGRRASRVNGARLDR